MRTYVEAVGQASAALAARPLRAALGGLAIAVAVATIVFVVTALDGVASAARQATSRAFGADTFLIAQVASPGRVSRRELELQRQRNPPIRRADVRFLDRWAEGLVTYAPNAQTRADVVVEGRRFENAAITGTTAALADLRDLAVGRGRFFSERESTAGAAVAVIGADLADTLFPGRDPIGRGVRVAGRRFEVIGVQDRLGNAGGTSLDRYVWMPLAAFERAFGAPPSVQIFAKAAPGLASVVGEDRARITMRARRALAPGVPDTFDLLTPDGARSFVQTLSARIGVAAGPISLMALLAAIVVVTNTVLVSVTERTREIGVRRALGARRAQIMSEVLAEAALVSVVGGAIGAFGAAGLLAVLAGLLDVPLDVAPSTVAFALAASGASGLVAGWYPARRATRIDVITAIRSE
ncbi:MAG: ABC transporter permease [Vicinamibacteria bacterium]